MRNILNIIFRKKSLNYILYLIVAAIIREALALGFDENFENLFRYLSEKYSDNDVEIYILLLQLILTKGSFLTLFILFILFGIISFLKFNEQKSLAKQNKEFDNLQKKINAILKKESYPDIYNEFFQKLTSKFSPDYTGFYLKNLMIDVSIHEIELNDIKLSQSTRVEIFTDKNQKYFKYKHPIINQVENDKRLEITSYELDGKDINQSSNKDIKLFENLFESKKSFSVEYKHNFKFSINENPIHLYKVNTYCSNIYFRISKPNDIEIELFDLGNNKITKHIVHNDNGGGITLSLREGVMPYDGFGIYFKKKK